MTITTTTITYILTIILIAIIITLTATITTITQTIIYHLPTHRGQLPHHHHHLPEKVTLGDLLTLGISGGLVPCPEALGIMLIAIGLNRIIFGLGLIVAFSFGLALVLIVIGILLVRSKALVDRWVGAGGRWQHVLPLVSAVIVTLLGLGIVVKGFLAYQ
jgi:ABC-type nickel/cobalt efflux system permease component RcnA